MSKVLVSASHFDTLCQDAWKLFEDNGIDVVFDPAKEFPAYTTEEIENHPDREDIVAALIGMDDFRDERKYQALPNLKAVAKFGVGVDLSLIHISHCCKDSGCCICKIIYFLYINTI